MRKVLLRASHVLRDRLRREGRVQARLRHPNLVRSSTDEWFSHLGVAGIARDVRPSLFRQPQPGAVTARLHCAEGVRELGLAQTMQAPKSLAVAKSRGEQERTFTPNDSSFDRAGYNRSIQVTTCSSFWVALNSGGHSRSSRGDILVSRLTHLSQLLPWLPVPIAGFPPEPISWLLQH